MDNIIKFPPSRFFAIQVLEHGDAWLVRAGEHGWLFADAISAFLDARWLAANWGLPIRCEAQP